jgi:ubiquinone/menaquinone biosynthesis C-methylase UbiE
MLARVLEPEVMDDADEAREYDAMDHTTVNRLFVDDFLQVVRETNGPRSRSDPWTVVDLGTGTALIPIELARRFSHSAGLEVLSRIGARRVRITAADLAGEMLELAEVNLRNAEIAHPASDLARPRTERFIGWPMDDSSNDTAAIALLLVDGKGTGLPDRAFDAVVSNSLVHHIPEPLAVFREFARVVKPGGWVFLRDLFRPESEAELDRLVSLHAAGATVRQRTLFADSLRAALTVEEVTELCRGVGWNTAARATSDRHWTVAVRTPV